MKARNRIRRALRTLALGGSICALALPAVAGAQPIDNPAAQPAPSSNGPSSTFHPHGGPAAFAGATITAGTGQQADALQQRTAYSPPADFVTDTQSGGAPSATSQTPSVVVREVHTVTNESNHTLSLVLASAALGIALCGSVYAVFRTTRIQRRVLGSNS
jgi:hypothetical protein